MKEPTVEAAAARDTAASLVKARRFAEAEAVLRDAAQRARSAGDAASLFATLQPLAELLRSQEQRIEAVPLFLEALAACRDAHGSADELGRLEASLAFTFVNIGLPDQATEHAAAALALAETTTRLDERIRALNAVALTNTRLAISAAPRACIRRSSAKAAAPMVQRKASAAAPSSTSACARTTRHARSNRATRAVRSCCAGNCAATAQP